VCVLDWARRNRRLYTGDPKTSFVARSSAVKKEGARDQLGCIFVDH
jgi:hypothetical protein